MRTQNLRGQDRLLAVWQNLAAHAASDGRVEYEVDPLGQVIDHRLVCPWHQLLVTDMFCQLASQLGPRVAMRQPVTTRSFGIRIVDVVWMPEEKWPEIDSGAPLPFVPELCIEVLADDNDVDHVERKADAYLNGGAQEVIIVGPLGQVEYRGLDGPRASSLFRVTLEPDPMFFAWA
ncbi:Uma2 family endonuclease [Paraburkholderia phymatum]|uniref:Uma2 family endonuclease n=1 Tax=Paraburkholderia phymatum TaxID=148447 RepID=UPI00317CAFC3